MKDIIVDYAVSETRKSDTRDEALTRLCKKLRDNGMPVYYSTKVHEIVVQSGKLAKITTNKGWQFIWERE